MQQSLVNDVLPELIKNYVCIIFTYSILFQNATIYKIDRNTFMPSGVDDSLCTTSFFNIIGCNYNSFKLVFSILCYTLYL